MKESLSNSFRTCMHGAAAFLIICGISLLSSSALATGLADQNETPNCSGGNGDTTGPSTPTGASPSLSDPVEFVTGDFLINETDMLVPGRGLDFVLRRHYRSRTGLTHNHSEFPWAFNFNSPIGNNWDHSLNIYLVTDYGLSACADFAPNSFHLFDGRGRAELFRSLNPGGTIELPVDCEEFGTNYQYHHARISAGGPTSYIDRLSQYIEIDDVERRPRMIFPDGSAWEFLSEAEQFVPGEFKISQMIDRHGNTMHFFV